MSILNPFVVALTLTSAAYIGNTQLGIFKDSSSHAQSQQKIVIDRPLETAELPAKNTTTIEPVIAIQSNPINQNKQDEKLTKQDNNLDRGRVIEIPVPSPENTEEIDSELVLPQVPNNHDVEIADEVARSSSKNSRKSYMKLAPTQQGNSMGNPIYLLTLYDGNGNEIARFETVSGRVNTQNSNRNRSGTQAPLPDGDYRVAQNTTKGRIKEAGDRFLPIYPKFTTGRSALGIHYDPSYEKDKKEDGTSGCIGLKNKAELNDFLQFVFQYKIQSLVVDIQ
jgi:L,D-transpeptidase catalytic domain